MTNRLVCAVRDSAVGAYAMPIVVPSAGIGVRSFTDEVNRKAEENAMFRHPDDFELHALAFWDDETGVYTAYDESKRVLCRAKDVHRGE